MVSIYDKNFRAFPLTGEKIEVLQSKKMKFRNAGYADIFFPINNVFNPMSGLIKSAELAEKFKKKRDEYSQTKKVDLIIWNIEKTSTWMNINNACYGSKKCVNRTNYNRCILLTILMKLK
jgi:hypothetical protein